MTTGDPSRSVRQDLADLLGDLQDAGFRVGASEAIDATALLLRLGTRNLALADPSRLRSRLRPVFCKSAYQQRQFDGIFDTWWSRVTGQGRTAAPPVLPTPATPATAPEKPQETRSGVIAGVVIGVAIIIGAYVFWPRPQPQVATPAPGTPPIAQTPQPTSPVTPAPVPAQTEPTVDRFVPAVRYNVEIRPWWVWVLGALPVAALLSVSLPVLVLSRTRLRRRSEPMFLDPAPLEIEARRLVPRVQPEIGDRLARHVRSRGIDIERQARRPLLDIRRTIEATLRNYGIPSLRFSVSRVHPSYTVLIDVASETDPRGRLFYQWAERLQREGLDVDLLLLRRMGAGDEADSLRVCNGEAAARGKPQWIPLRRRREPLFGERLIVISDGDLFVDASGQWRADALRARFYRWRDRAVFTPVEPRDWGPREESLEEPERVTDPGFLVLPLEESALGAWTDLVLTGQLSTIALADPQRFPALLRKSRRGQFEGDAPPPETVERLIQQLHLYLGDRGFYWLAAIAATPVIRWELTLLLGKAALERLPSLGDQESLNASLARNYRRLVRLPWLQRQAMPDWLRLRLLVELSQAQQTELREVVEGLLGKLSPNAVADGIELGFERPPGSEVGRETGRRRPGAAPTGTGDQIYLGYMSGLSPDQLVLRAPREWASWTAGIPIRREPGLRGRLAQLRARVRAEWARWMWAGGLPHLGLNRRRAFALVLLILPLVGTLFAVGRRPPSSPLIAPTWFFQEREHERIISAPGVRAVAFSPDGSRIATGQEDGKLQIWDARSQRLIGALLSSQGPAITSLAYTGDGTVLASRSDDGLVRLWNPQSGILIGAPLEVPGSYISAMALTPDGSRIAVGTTERISTDLLRRPAAEVLSTFSNRPATLRVFDPRTRGERDAPLQGHKGSIQAIAFSADGYQIATAGSDATLLMWAAETIGTPFEGYKGLATSLAFSPDGSRLVSGGTDATARLWNTSALRGIATMDGHEGPVTKVAFSPDGARIVSASENGTIRLWDGQTGAAVGSPLRGHTDKVVDVSFTSDSQLFASASLDGTVRFWDARIAEVKATVATQGGVFGVAFSPNGDRIVSGGSDRTLQMWNAATLRSIGAPMSGHTDDVNWVAFSPDGERLASASDDRTIRLWDVRTRSVIGALQGHTGGVWCVVFRPNGRLLASASADSTIRLWDALTGAPVGTPMRGHTNEVVTLVFSPDGQTLVSGGDDGSLRVWDVRTGQLASQPAIEHDQSVWSVAFSPDGNRLLAGRSDGTVDVLDARTNKPTGSLRAAGDKGVTTILFARNGRHIVAATGDGTVTTWDASTLETIGSASDKSLSSVWSPSLALSPQGAYAAMSGTQGTPNLVLWRLNSYPLKSRRYVATAQRTVLDTVRNMPGRHWAYWLLGAIVGGAAVRNLVNERRITRLLPTNQSQS